MGWIFFFSLEELTKKIPQIIPQKCLKIISSLLFSTAVLPSSLVCVFLNSIKSLHPLLFFHIPDLLPHSQVLTWVTEGTPVSTVRTKDGLDRKLWYEPGFESDPWLPGSEIAWNNDMCGAYDVMRRTRLVRRWVSYFFDGRKHGRAFCVLLAVTDGFKHDFFLRMFSMFHLCWHPHHSSTWRVFAAFLSPSTWLMLRCGREGLIKVTQSESNQIWGRVQKLRGWRSRDWSVGVREWQVMLCYVQQTIIAYMDDVALWVCAHLESSHKFSFFPRVTEIFSECI